jgi:hypothetical protein
MNKIRLLLSVGMLALTIGVGLTYSFRVARADESGRECNCVRTSTNESGLLCKIDGITRCCPGGCYEIAPELPAEN